MTFEYRWTEEITVENISHFIEKFKTNSLPEYFKSLQISENKDNGNDIKTIVGLNFKEEVLNTEKPVLVIFHNHMLKNYNLFEILKTIKNKLKPENNLIITKFDLYFYKFKN